MAQTSLAKTNRAFTDSAKAKAAGANNPVKGRHAAPEFINLRRQQVIEMKVRGLTNAEIAKHFNVSEHTIERDVKAIRKNGLVEKYEARFLGKLMPLALNKLVKHLEKDDGDLEGVKEVFKRFDRLSEQKHQRELVEGGQQEETLSGWYDQWLAAKNAAAEAPPTDAVEVEFTGGDVGSNHEAESEEGVATSGAGRPSGASGESSPETTPATRADASEGGLEASPESRVGPSSDPAGGLGAGV